MDELHSVTVASGMSWAQTSDPIEDIRQLAESLKNQPYHPSQLLAKVVDWLPKQEPDGTWLHWQIQPDGFTLCLSQHAYDELKRLPEGVDAYGLLKGMVTQAAHPMDSSSPESQAGSAVQELAETEPLD